MYGHIGPPPPPGFYGPRIGPPPPPMYGRPYGYGPRYHDDVVCCCNVFWLIIYLSKRK